MDLSRPIPLSPSTSLDAAQDAAAFLSFKCLLPGHVEHHRLSQLTFLLQ